MAFAQINADKADEDEALRKNLWLRIARHVVEEKRDIKQWVSYILQPLHPAFLIHFNQSHGRAMEYLKHSDLLKIEDVLLFVPDFVLIHDLEEQICGAPELYTLDFYVIRIKCRARNSSVSRRSNRTPRSTER